MSGDEFKEAMGDVTPLADQNRILPPKPSVHAIVRQNSTAIEISDVLSDHGVAPEEFRRNGLSRIALHRLRNSPIEDSLDLHGNTVEGARLLLQQFLFEARERGLRCVRIIHGKGMNSRGNEAVLRAHARNWLYQHPEVLAYCQAPPNQGGSGAALVLLKVRT